MALQGLADSSLKPLPKAPTGIAGLDEITGGGLPKGRPTLICGGAGSGKTLLSTEFLVRGATEYGEPGVFVTFEERPEDLAQNVASLGFDLDALVEQELLSIDFVYIDKSEIEETGEYDLEGLFLRLGFAIDSIGAKRVVLDTLEALFGGLSNEGIVRAELRRLFRWLKDRDVTAVITAERGPEGHLTRHGLEEYVSDCVILLDHRVSDQVSTRRLRVVKYRGTSHGTNEYPFLISDTGFSVMPITSIGLNHNATSERISTGIPRLDDMLEGEGYYRGSSILISGTAGAGKSSVASHFAEATCKGGERCLYFAFEESPNQITRNMASIGINLARWRENGLLRFQSMRPTFNGLETHLATMHKLIAEFRPAVVIVDPITNFLAVGQKTEVESMLVRLIDFLKQEQITALFTSLTGGGHFTEQSEAGISSLIDTWLLLRDTELDGERNRVLYVLKSRGMAHSNQLREFKLTSQGVQLVDAYLGRGRVLTGSARLAQEAQEELEASERQREIVRKRLELERKRKALEAQVAALQADLLATGSEEEQIDREEQQSKDRLAGVRAAMARSRKVMANGSVPGDQEPVTGD